MPLATAAAVIEPLFFQRQSRHFPDIPSFGKKHLSGEDGEVFFAIITGVALTLTTFVLILTTGSSIVVMSFRILMTQSGQEPSVISIEHPDTERQTSSSITTVLVTAAYDAELIAIMIKIEPNNFFILFLI
jgi:hypothetical protein